MLICLMKHAGLPLCKTKVKENTLKCGDLSDASQPLQNVLLFGHVKCLKRVFSEGILEGNKAGVLLVLGVRGRAAQRGLASSGTPEGTA